MELHLRHIGSFETALPGLKTVNISLEGAPVDCQIGNEPLPNEGRNAIGQESRPRGLAPRLHIANYAGGLILDYEERTGELSLRATSSRARKEGATVSLFMSTESRANALSITAPGEVALRGIWATGNLDVNADRISMQDVRTEGSVSAVTGNGSLQLSEIQAASVNGQTDSGNITAERITTPQGGSITLHTKEGDILASDLQADLVQTASAQGTTVITSAQGR